MDIFHWLHGLRFRFRVTCYNQACPNRNPLRTCKTSGASAGQLPGQDAWQQPLQQLRPGFRAQEEWHDVLPQPLLPIQAQQEVHRCLCSKPSLRLACACGQSPNPQSMQHSAGWHCSDMVTKGSTASIRHSELGPHEEQQVSSQLGGSLLHLSRTGSQQP